jgi:hypothetical protein
VKGGLGSKASTLPGRCWWRVAVTLLLLFTGRVAMALPSMRCETVRITDRDAISQQMGLARLVEKMKSIPLNVVPDKTAADIALDLTFSSASGRITAEVRKKSPRKLRFALVSKFGQQPLGKFE